MLGKLIDEHRKRPPDLTLQTFSADPLLQAHEARATLFLDLLRHSIRQSIGCRAVNWRIGEAADPIELRFLQKPEQLFEVSLCLTRKSDDEGAADRDIRAHLAPAADAGEIILHARRTFHR